MLRSIFLTLLTGLFGATTATAQVDVGGMFKDYTPISTPQSDVPVGAQWVPGIGPAGDAADSSNIRVSKGAANVDLSGNSQKSIGFSLASFLGLNGEKAKKTKIKLENISIYRVKDFSALKVGAGQQAITAAVKAGSISIESDEATVADIKAAASARGIPISGEFGSGKSKKLVLNGSDLFVAFQVIEFKADGKPKEKTYRHDGKAITIADTYAFDFCRCGPDDAIRIHIRNLAAATVGGEFPLKTVNSKDSPNATVEVPLPSYLRGSKMTTASALISYDSGESCFATTTDGKDVCLLTFPKQNNEVRLRTRTISFVPVKQPMGSL